MLERMRHHIPADAAQAHRTLEPLQHRTRMASHRIQLHHHFVDDGVQLLRSLPIPVRSGFIVLHIKPRKQIRPAIHTALSAHGNRPGRQFLRPHHHRPPFLLCPQFHQLPEVIQIPRAVLDPDDTRDIHQLLHRLRLDHHLRHRRHVVKMQRQRQRARQLGKVIIQLRLARPEIIRRARHHRVRAMVRRMVRQLHAFLENGVRHTHQHRQPTRHDPAGFLHHLPPQPVAQARPLARRTQQEQRVDLTPDQMLDQSPQPFPIQHIGSGKRRDQWRNDPPDRRQNG